MDTRILTPDEMDEALSGMKPRQPAGRSAIPILAASLVVEIIGVSSFLAWWLL